MARRVQKFGGENTSKKQDVLAQYLSAYATALRSKFEISYVDAFAGSGWRIDAGAQASEEGLFAARQPRPKRGSALSALGIEPPFHRYVFGDKNSHNVAALRAAVAREHSADGASRVVEIIAGDANDLILNECKRLAVTPNSLAVVFLDPFGMQVRWDTLAAIALSRRIDLWLLVPTDIAINRLIPRSGVIPESWATALTRFLGTDDWKQRFYASDHDLFGSKLVRKVRQGELIGYIMGRLRSLFGEGLYPAALELPIKGRPAYHLVFACSSHSPRARALALRIAGYIMERHRLPR